MSMMVAKTHDWRFARILYILPLVVGLIFMYLVYWTSVGDASRPFSIQLTILIPEIIIWQIAMVSAVRFKRYALAIKGSPDGESLNYIANALLLMVAYIIVLTTAGTIVTMLKDTSLAKMAVSSRNHLPVAIALSSVAYLYYGAHKLTHMVPPRVWRRRHIVLLILVSTAFFVLFAWEFYRSVPYLQPVNGVPRFALPVDALLFTYVLPHIILWLCGLLACLKLAHYASVTPGKLYRAVFKDLYRGILLIYLCTFMAQLLIISSITVARLTISLGIVYGILVLTTIGFVLLYRGASRLHKIEHAV